jgi:hypothetical protein
MSLWLWAQLLIVHGGASVVAAFAGVLGFRLRRGINADGLGAVLRKVLADGRRDRAVKLCRSIDVPASALALHALGLEEPAARFGAQDADAGFRQVAAASPFAERAARSVDEARRALAARQRPLLLLAGVALLGSAASQASRWLGQPALEWRSLPDVIAVAGAVAAVLALRVRAKINRGLERVQELILPELRPREELDENARAAAADARAALARSRFAACAGGSLTAAARRAYDPSTRGEEPR